ncbi:hypothetical protein C8Q69DRAFT_69706 [Paecilomyces variotii]|uniref:Uncharacterized protein n=1 Tax=Byssochlamys spectabilis TaxID=264951 RepID=A0A443HNN0_BYSSP|nr:hypothetical protein C8Q69DRAFT_69706 [Paecilomyces variotii]RWQ93409.1 hypothetical protein C8Q69DRAFT_69706 [Paecilomyces variotii]
MKLNFRAYIYLSSRTLNPRSQYHDSIRYVGAHCSRSLLCPQIPSLLVSAQTPTEVFRKYHFEDETALGSDGVKRRSVVMDMPLCDRPRKPRPLRSTIDVFYMSLGFRNKILTVDPI